MIIRYAAKARRDLDRFEQSVAERIVKKMAWFAEREDPLGFAEPLSVPGRHLYRFEISDYRAICTIEHGTVTILLVLAVRNRKDAYWDL